MRTTVVCQAFSLVTALNIMVWLSCTPIVTFACVFALELYTVFTLAMWRDCQCHRKISILPYGNMHGAFDLPRNRAKQSAYEIYCPAGTFERSRKWGYKYSCIQFSIIVQACLTPRPQGHSWPRELWYSIYLCTYRMCLVTIILLWCVYVAIFCNKYSVQDIAIHSQHKK